MKILADAERPSHAAAIAQLAIGRPAQAVKQLETLTRTRPRDAELWSDLSAARYELAERNKDPSGYASALAAADLALDIAETLPAPLFNRALSLQALGLHFAAVDAWQQYVRVDADSSWATEAHRRMATANVPSRDARWRSTLAAFEAALDTGDREVYERTVRSFPQQARRWAEGVYLPQWGDEVLAGNTTAARRTLARVRRIAATLQKLDGDTFLRDVVKGIDDLGRNTRSIASACVAYRRGRVESAARRLENALLSFTAAERQFVAHENPMSALTACYRAHTLIDLGEISAGENVRASLSPSDYVGVRAHQWWLAERLATSSGRIYDALVAVRAARELFDKIGDLDHVTRLRTSEGALLALVGRDAEAWQARHAALSEAAASGKWNLVEVAIQAIVREELTQGSTEIANALLKVQIAVPSTLPLMRFDALLSRSFLHSRFARRPPDLTPALSAASAIPDLKQRAHALDELELFRALAISKEQPAVCEQLLTRVIDYRTRHQLTTYLPNIYNKRGEARRAARRLIEAEADFRKAISLIEERKSGIGDDALRETYLGDAEEAYLALADVLLDRGAWRESAEIAAQQRSGNVSSLSDVIEHTPRGAVAVVYTTLPSRTLMIVVADGVATHSIVDVGRRELTSLRHQLLAAASGRNVAKFDHLSRRVHSLLIEPWQRRLVNDSRLIVIPDHAIAGIPFSALRDTDGRYLVERAQIEIGKSWRVAGHEQPSTSHRSVATIVADPAFSRTLFPGFQRLPAARRDAEALKSIYPNSISLVGNLATLQAFRRAAADSDVIHVAAHAFSSARDASVSVIALSESPSDDGVLYLRDIPSLSLHKLPIVVLAACETAVPGGGNSSTRSLAHGFLDAGSRAVLATLWNIEDDVASGVTRRFYQNLAAGSTPAAALRRTQLALLHSGVTRDWATYQLYVQ